MERSFRLEPPQPIRPGTRALIFGRASSVWAEIALAKGLCDFDTVIGINRAGAEYPGRMDHWVTLHPDQMSNWIDRRKKFYPDQPDPILWSAFFNNHWIGDKVALDLLYVRSDGGSSGMLAVEVALTLGIEKSVLCGIPLERTSRYDDNRPWREADNHQRAWRKMMPVIHGRVKSMSGWTRKMLGEPTEEWLDVGEGAANRSGTD